MDAQTPPAAKAAAPPPKPTGLTRRRLLIGTGAGAALLIGYAVWPRDVRLNLPVRQDETLINGFLKIARDGRITVVCPQAEMGQGVYTALPQLLAAELGADWNMVGVEPAPLHPIYANRAFVDGVGESMPSLLGGIAKWAAVSVIERFEVQATGGSTSVKAYWEPLRMAGAAARALFIRAGARRLGLDAGDLDTADGFVAGGGKRVSFVDLLPHIDPDDLPAEPELRQGATIIGQSVPRIDIPAKTNGSAIFGADVRLPGMAYA
ncbi:MAG: xanthine dehydrogenase family protein molybdopterin-binding subunit, partial [Pacificimonas sp.]